MNSSFGKTTSRWTTIQKPSLMRNSLNFACRFAKTVLLAGDLAVEQADQRLRVVRHAQLCETLQNSRATFRNNHMQTE